MPGYLGNFPNAYFKKKCKCVTNGLILVIETKCQEIDRIISPFLDKSIIVQNRAITIEYDKFLETLMNNLLNCMMAHQHKEITNITLRDMRNRLSVLQLMNLTAVSNLYQELINLEKYILDFDDNLNLRNCWRTKLWHSLNFEKPS